MDVFWTRRAVDVRFQTGRDEVMRCKYCLTRENSDRCILKCLQKISFWLMCCSRVLIRNFRFPEKVKSLPSFYHQGLWRGQNPKILKLWPILSILGNNGYVWVPVWQVPPEAWVGWKWPQEIQGKKSSHQSCLGLNHQDKGSKAEVERGVLGNLLGRASKPLCNLCG